MTQIEIVRLLVDVLGVLAFAAALINVPAMWTIGRRIAYAKRTQQNGGVANALWGQMSHAIVRCLIGVGVVVLISFRGGLYRLLIVLYLIVLGTLYVSIADWWRTRRAVTLARIAREGDAHDLE